MNNLPILSASKLKAFKKCPRQYYYKYINHTEQGDDKNMSALLGSALHKAIELYYKEGKTNYTYEFQQYMQHTIELWDEKGYTVSYEYNFMRDLKDGKAFLKKIDWDFFNPTELELRFSLPFPKENPIVIINGVIDMICDGMVIDHKSGKEKPNKQELAHDPQFILYHWAYEQLYGKPPEIVYWHHLRTGKLIESRIKDNYADKIQQLTVDIQAMLSTTVYHRKEQDSFCRKVCAFYEKCFGEKAQPDEEEENERVS